MKSRKVLLPFLALGLAVVAPVMFAEDAPKAPPAQGQGQRGGGRGQQSPEQRYEAIETAVGKLSAEQKTKIMAILTKSAADMQAIPQEDRRTKGQEMRAAANKEIAALLTKEQAEKFAAMPQGGRQGGGQGGQGGQGGAKKGN